MTEAAVSTSTTRSTNSRVEETDICPLGQLTPTMESPGTNKATLVAHTPPPPPKEYVPPKQRGPPDQLIRTSLPSTPMQNLFQYNSSDSNNIEPTNDTVNSSNNNSNASSQKGRQQHRKDRYLQQRQLRRDTPHKIENDKTANTNNDNSFNIITDTNSSPTNHDSTDQSIPSPSSTYATSDPTHHITETIQHQFQLIQNQLDRYLHPYQHLQQQHDKDIDTLIAEVDAVNLSHDKLLAKYDRLRSEYDQLKAASTSSDDADLHLQQITFATSMCQTLKIRMTNMHEVLSRMYQYKNADAYTPVLYTVEFFETLYSYPGTPSDKDKYQTYVLNMRPYLELHPKLTFNEIEDLLPTSFHIRGTKKNLPFMTNSTRSSNKTTYHRQNHSVRYRTHKYRSIQKTIHHTDNDSMSSTDNIAHCGYDSNNDEDSHIHCRDASDQSSYIDHSAGEDGNSTFNQDNDTYHDISEQDY